MDTLTLQEIQLLHPKVRQEVSEAYKHVNNNLFGKNIRLRFTDTFRSFEEQDNLYSLGRTKLYDVNGKHLNKVTNAKAGQSMHNYGLAFDMVILADKDNNGSFETALWNIQADNDNDGLPDWLEATIYFKKLGWIWGGDWKKFPDYPHFEKTFGHTWQTLEKKYLSGDTFTEEINGKIYKWVNL